MLTFRMRIGVRFNREIDPKEHNISIGGYEMIMGGGTISFDFEDYSGSVCESDRCVVDWEMKDPDYDTFQDLSRVTEDMLKSVEEISEVYVDVDDNLVPVSLDYVAFILPYDDWKLIEVPDHIVKSFSFSN